MEFHVPAGEKVTPEELTLEKSRSLVSAIDASDCWHLHDVYQRLENDVVCEEAIVAEVTCDSIPSRNKTGIEYREVIEFKVAPGRLQMPSTIALRKTFPETAHQNVAPQEDPRDLCLYFEDSSVALRHWTAERHLKRTAWWLENTAKETLHPADQPVEGLFLESPHELVVPHDALNPDQDTELFIVGYVKREKGLTYIADYQKTKENLRPEIFVLHSPPIVHGRIENLPFNLVDLLDYFSQRGADLKSILKEKIYNIVPEEGVDKLQQECPTLLVVITPLCREVDGEIEKHQTSAFLSWTNYQKMGEALNVLSNHEELRCNRFIDLGDQSLDRADLANIKLEPLHLLKNVNARSQRYQSNSPSVGPNGAIVGVGALGSTILEAFCRSGWGEWLAMDKDHLRPHNLTRHIAYRYLIGEHKAKAVSWILNQATEPGRITPSVIDAENCEVEEIEELLSNKDLVVDVSTTLGYPRRASEIDALPRHASCFLTPNGYSSALLVEDSARSIRLASLEAQYYRGILNSGWGDNHIGDLPKSFWSGGSCRDISFQLGYSRVLSHAGVLTESLMNLTENASIQIFSENDHHERTVHEVRVFPSIQQQLGNRTVYFDEGLIEKLSTVRQNRLPNETGGILVGYHDLLLNAVFIVDALIAPPDSEEARSYFIRGVEGLTDWMDEIKRKTAGEVEYIGEWHSHPPNHSADASGEDLAQLLWLSREMAKDGLPAYSLIVGDNDANVLQGIYRDGKVLTEPQGQEA